MRTAAACRCLNRGSVGPDGELHQVDDEVEDVLCVLDGRKPLAVVHATLLGATKAFELQACSVDVYQSSDVSDGTIKPTPLVVSSGLRNAWRVQAADCALRRLGAWPRTEACDAFGLSDVASHVALGLLLGYPASDIEGLHRGLRPTKTFDHDLTIAEQYLAHFSASQHSFP